MSHETGTCRGSPQQSAEGCSQVTRGERRASQTGGHRRGNRRKPWGTLRLSTGRETRARAVGVAVSPHRCPLPPPTGLGGHPGSHKRCLSTKDTGASIACQTNSFSGHRGQFVPPPLGKGETQRALALATWFPGPRVPRPAISLGLPQRPPRARKPGLPHDFISAFPK